MYSNNRVLKFILNPSKLEFVLGILLNSGITTLEEKKNGKKIELTVQIPKNKPAKGLLRQIVSQEKAFGEKLFHQAKVYQIKGQAWQQEYQKHLKPFTLPQPKALSSIPAINVDPRGKVVKKTKHPTLFIQAKLAFGTGSHPSTQLAAYLLQELLNREPNSSLLDVGCGTGILAMVAKLRKAGQVVAVDNDPVALSMAKENFIKNNFSNIILQSSLKGIRKRYKVVVANIIATQLINLHPILSNRIKKNGFLILSGLTYRDIPDILKTYSNLEVLKRKNDRGWTALLLKM